MGKSGHRGPHRGTSCEGEGGDRGGAPIGQGTRDGQQAQALGEAWSGQILVGSGASALLAPGSWTSGLLLWKNKVLLLDLTPECERLVKAASELAGALLATLSCSPVQF